MYRRKWTSRWTLLNRHTDMTEKPPVWADWLLVFWIVAVAVFYFGGVLLPDQIGRYTAAASVLYALLLLVSVGAMAFRYLNQSKNRK